MEEGCLRCHGSPEDAPAALVQRYGAERGFHRPLEEVVALDIVAVPTALARGGSFVETASHCAALVGGAVLLAGLIIWLFRVLVARRLAHVSGHLRNTAHAPEGMRVAELNKNPSSRIP